VVLGTSRAALCLDNNSCGNALSLEPKGVGVGPMASSSSITPSEDGRPRSCHPVGILSPSPPLGAVPSGRDAGAGGSDQQNPLHISALGTNEIHDVEFLITGGGVVTDPIFCGTWSRTYACSQDPKHFMRSVKHHCDNPSCPECMPSWSNKAARRIAERIRGYIECANNDQSMLDEDDFMASIWHKDNTRYLNHYIMSCRPEMVNPRTPFNAIKQMGRQTAARAGITGGVMIFHPYRIKKALQTKLKYVCRSVCRMNEEDREKKFWELVREDVLKLGGWRAYIEWGPHFHVIGFGKLPEQKTPEQKEAVKETMGGWIVLWIRHVQTERYFNGQDVEDPIASLAAYILSHAGYQAGRKIPSWLGVCGPNRLKKAGAPEHKSEAVVCPKCGSPVVLGSEVQGNFVPDYDECGDVIPYRLRYCDQKYLIKRRWLKRQN
jgi:hypothetical protein